MALWPVFLVLSHTPILPPKIVYSDRVRPIVASTQPFQEVTVELDSILSIRDLDTVRLEQEKVLLALIADTPDSEVEEKTDFYFRLGTIYAAQFKKTGSKDYLLKTVKIFKTLSENDAFRNYPKMDMALFYYGYTLQRGKYLKEARAVYDKLLKNYPNSRYVPEAHLAFAEYYFEASQMADAEARYKMVLKFPKSSAYWYAMYKLGKVHFSLARYQDALEVYFQVASATKDTLHAAALAGFTRAYAEIGKADKAALAFQRVDGNKTIEMLSTLAEIYEFTGKLDKAIAIHRELLSKQPGNANACYWQSRIARATLGIGTPTETTREIEGLVKSTGCRDLAAAMATEVGQAYHADPTTIPLAEKLYGIYLDAFPAAPDRSQIAFYRGEALWTIAEGETNARLRPERWEKVADAFAAVIDGPFAKTAKVDAILAMQNVVDLPAVTIDLATAARAKAPAPREPSARDAKVLAAIDGVIPTLSDNDEVARLRVVYASILRRVEQFDKAVPVLAMVVAAQGPAETIELAANLMLEAQIRLERFDAVLELADKLANMAHFLDDKPALAKNIAFVRSRSLRRR